MTKKFYEVVCDEEPTGDILTDSDLRKEYEECKALDQIDNTCLESFIEDQIVNGEIEEIELSYEEIECLLTEEQNQITFETFPPYELDDYTYDHSLRVFTVPYSWYLRWLEENYFVPETSNRDDDDYFHAEYIWDDTMLMYDCALEDGVVIKEEIIPR